MSLKFYCVLPDKSARLQSPLPPTLLRKMLSCYSNSSRGEGGYMALANGFIDQLTAALPNIEMYTDPADCWPYSYDNSRRQALPDVVIFATTTEHIQTILKLCNQFKIPVLARGLGSGTTGGSVPVAQGVVIALEKMNRIINIDPANRCMTVEPGVTNQAVQQAATAHGFFWPPDPTSAAYSTIGGNLALNSAGPRAVKYGTPRDNVLGLMAVTGAGDIIRTGAYTTKSVVGFDLTRLIIGSEGTLAIITEATLKLTPLPQSKRTLRAIYQNITHAAQAVSAIMAQPVTPCSLEFMDGQAIAMICDYSAAELPQTAGALLLIDVDGPEVAMLDAVHAIKAAASNPGLLDFAVAANDDEAKKLWDTRKALSPALRKLAPKKINEDVVVPVAAIPELISGLEKLAAHYQIKNVNFGHAGNGNIHVNLLLDPEDTKQMEQAAACLDEVFNLVLKLRGSISGEHGVGLEKRAFVARELSSTTLELIKKIKAQFDPLGILNPNKAF